MNKTGIEWCDWSSNPIYALRKTDGKRGHACVHASPGCVNCYSERWNRWRGTGLKFNVPDLQKVDIILDVKELARMRKVKGGKVFVCDMTDLFGPFVPDDYISEVFAAMVANERATWQVLTKRPARMAAFVKQHYPDPLPNVWYGTSTEDQTRADERIPELLKIPAVVHFLSCEPLIGTVRLADGWLYDYVTGRRDNCFIDWIIGGGESGPGARPCSALAARHLRDQCIEAGIPFFWKQWGEWLPIERGLDVVGDNIYRGADGRRISIHDVMPYPHEIVHDRGVVRMGKKAAGRELDGRTWDEFPESAVPA